MPNITLTIANRAIVAKLFRLIRLRGHTNCDS